MWESDIEWITANDVPTLRFSYDRQGNRKAVTWKTDAEGWEEYAADQERVQEEQAALYFDADDVLDLAKMYFLQKDAPSYIQSRYGRCGSILRCNERRNRGAHRGVRQRDKRS